MKCKHHNVALQGSWQAVIRDGDFKMIIGVDSGHFLFELNDRQNSRFVYTTLKSYHKASAQVLSKSKMKNLMSKSCGPFSLNIDQKVWYFKFKY